MMNSVYNVLKDHLYSSIQLWLFYLNIY